MRSAFPLVALLGVAVLLSTGCIRWDVDESASALVISPPPVDPDGRGLPSWQRPLLRNDSASATFVCEGWLSLDPDVRPDTSADADRTVIVEPLLIAQAGDLCSFCWGDDGQTYWGDPVCEPEMSWRCSDGTHTRSWSWWVYCGGNQ